MSVLTVPSDCPFCASKTPHIKDLSTSETPWPASSSEAVSLLRSWRSRVFMGRLICKRGSVVTAVGSPEDPDLRVIVEAWPNTTNLALFALKTRGFRTFEGG